MFLIFDLEMDANPLPDDDFDLPSVSNEDDDLKHEDMSDWLQFLNLDNLGLTTNNLY